MGKNWVMFALKKRNKFSNCIQNRRTYKRKKNYCNKYSLCNKNNNIARLVYGILQKTKWNPLTFLLKICNNICIAMRYSHLQTRKNNKANWNTRKKCELLQKIKLAANIKLCIFDTVKNGRKCRLCVRVCTNKCLKM